VPTVLYIAGCTRSGSTLVDRALGRVVGVVSTGELGLITSHGITDNRLCGCGARFRECEFWTAVGRAAFGSWDSAEAAELVRLHPLVDRHRHVLALAVPRLFPRFERRLTAYARLLGQLYAAIAQVAGARCIVDSTKAPAYALVLRRAPGVDMRTVQLVRDSRGTAYSAGKRQMMQDSIDRPVHKHRYPPAVITSRWMLYHLLFDAIALRDGNRLLVRYEDFVRSPAEVITGALAHAGVDVAPQDLDFVGDGWLDLATAHTVAGNDMRLETGRVKLREDAEWRRHLRRSHRLVVTALSWPMLRRFDYR
jgi:hypothetical protein